MFNSFSDDTMRRLSNEELSAIFANDDSYDERRILLEQESQDLGVIIARSKL
jgi:hypothetical protein